MDLKQAISKLDGSKPIELRMEEGKKLEVVGVCYSGYVSGSNMEYVIPQAVILK